jgi:dienelactone hydrolase
MGRNAFVCEKAQELAKLGYIGFAVDLYGEGRVAQNGEEAGALMKPLFMDRQLLQKRIFGAMQALVQQPEVDAGKVGAIGFCFGGLTVIELLRSGADVKGVVSFHGILGSQKEGNNVKTASIAKSIKGSLLVLHGYHDPYVPVDNVLHLQKEMTDANVDWQFNTYGNAGHSFTNPEENDKKGGKFYEPKTCDRAWLAMKIFFEEIF